MLHLSVHQGAYKIYRFADCLPLTGMTVTEYITAANVTNTHFRTNHITEVISLTTSAPRHAEEEPIYYHVRFLPSSTQLRSFKPPQGPMSYQKRHLYERACGRQIPRPNIVNKWNTFPVTVIGIDHAIRDTLAGCLLRPSQPNPISLSTSYRSCK